MKTRMAAHSILQNRWESRCMAREKETNKRMMEVAGTGIKRPGGTAALANMEKPKLPSGVESHFL